MSKYHQDKRKIEFIVGLTITLSVLILLLGLSWFKNYLNFYKYQDINVFFDNVNNITQGSAVTIFGVKKGVVKKITVNNDGVLLTLQIEKTIPLKESSEFFIRESDLMGTREVSIKPGKYGKIIDENFKLKGNIKYGLSHLVSELNKIVVTTEKIVNRLETEEELINSLQKVILKSPQLIDKLDITLTNFDKNFNRFSNKMEKAAINIDSLVTTNDENIKMIITNLNILLSEINKENINEISKNTAKFSQKLNTKDSTVNQLISNRELYDKLMKTTSEIDSLIIDIKKHPKKYINFSLF